MTTLEVEIAVMEHFGVRQNLIVPNVSWGIEHNGLRLHECDMLILTNSNYATEVEIKVTRADLLKDKEKSHGHSHPLISRLYYAVPEKLKDLALQEIPERAGLLVVKWYETYYSRRLINIQVKSPRRNTKAVKWSESDRQNLSRLGAMRILTLKKNILKLRRKPELITEKEVKNV